MDLRYRVLRGFKDYAGVEKVEHWSYHDTWAKASWTREWCDKRTDEVKWVQRRDDDGTWVDWNWPKEHAVIGCCEPDE